MAVHDCAQVAHIFRGKSVSDAVISTLEQEGDEPGLYVQGNEEG
jgi:hypothetical protein